MTETQPTREQTITIKVKFGSDWQKEMFYSFWRALEIGGLRYWEGKHKNNRIDISYLESLPSNTNE